MRDPKVCELCGVEIKNCPMRSPDYCGLASRYVRLRDWLITYQRERVSFRAEMFRKRGIPDLSRLRAIEAEIENIIEDWGLNINEKENSK